MTALSVYTSNDITGHYVGASAVVVAETEEQAKELLVAELKQHGLKFNGTLVRLPIDKPKVRVLQDGDY
jgi:hypothetical protein